MRYTKYTIMLNKQGQYEPVRCVVLRDNEFGCAVGISGGDIKITSKEYLFNNEYEATECALDLNTKIRKVGEKHEGQKN